MKIKDLIKNGFFGWENFKWIIRELYKTLSSEPSYFSQKRLFTSTAFITGIFGMLFYLIKKWETMTELEFYGWAIIIFTVAGYNMSQIQKNKFLEEKVKENKRDDNPN